MPAIKPLEREIDNSNINSYKANSKYSLKGSVKKLSKIIHHYFGVYSIDTIKQFISRDKKPTKAFAIDYNDINGKDKNDYKDDNESATSQTNLNNLEKSNSTLNQNLNDNYLDVKENVKKEELQELSSPIAMNSLGSQYSYKLVNNPNSISPYRVTYRPNMENGKAKLKVADFGRTTLWMGDLVSWITEQQLINIWASLGYIVTIKLIQDKRTGQMANYCFVNFESPEIANEALTLNGTLIPSSNKIFRLNWATTGFGDSGAGVSTLPVAPEFSLFVGDLEPTVDDYELLKTFQEHYKSSKSAKVIFNSTTGLPRGYGFVRFSDEDEYQKALIEMQGKLCSGKPMRISTASTKQGGQQYRIDGKSDDLIDKNDINQKEKNTGGTGLRKYHQPQNNVAKPIKTNLNRSQNINTEDNWRYSLNNDRRSSSYSTGWNLTTAGWNGGIPLYNTTGNITEYIPPYIQSYPIQSSTYSSQIPYYQNIPYDEQLMEDFNNSANNNNKMNKSKYKKDNLGSTKINNSMPLQGGYIPTVPMMNEIYYPSILPTPFIQPPITPGALQGSSTLQNQNQLQQSQPIYFTPMISSFHHHNINNDKINEEYNSEEDEDYQSTVTSLNENESNYSNQ